MASHRLSLRYARGGTTSYPPKAPGG